MKLALVTETFPPEVNGVAMTLKRIVDGMVARGHEVQVVRPRQDKSDTTRSNGRLHELVVPGVPLPRYEGLKMGLPAKGKLKKQWRSWQPDVVHIATEGPLGWSALGAAEALKKPISSSFHTNFHQYSNHYGFGAVRGLFEWHLRRIHNRCGCTMVPSADVKEQLEADGFERVCIVARGIDGELFNPQRRSADLRRSWGVAGDEPVMAYVGRMAAEKNIALAVEAFEVMREAEPSAKFVLVGDGPARADIEKTHPDYIYAGMRRGEDLASHYASADVFLFPSVTETFGNVVTEAMASGLCVLAYDYAAPRAYIEHGVSGFLAKFDDREHYLETARQIMQDKVDVRDLGRAAAAVAKGITWDAVVDRFEAKLDEVHRG